MSDFIAQSNMFYMDPCKYYVTYGSGTSKLFIIFATKATSRILRPSSILFITFLIGLLIMQGKVYIEKGEMTLKCR